MKRHPLIACAAALLVSHGAWAKCYQDHDKFAGTTRHWCAMGGLAFGEALDMSGQALVPIPVAVVKDASDIQFGIQAIWKNSSWLFISPGTEFVFILDDGARITLTTPDGSAAARDVSIPTPAIGVMVREEAIFPISADDMKRLASAKRAEFAVYGQKGRFEGALSARALKYYRELFETVLPPGP